MVILLDIRSLRGFITKLALSLLVFGQAGCDGLLDVTATDVITGEDLANRQGAEVRYTGAVSSFTDAFAADLLSVAITSGLMADELVALSVTGSWGPFDLRNIPDPWHPHPYDQLHRARVTALDALDAFEAYVPGTDSRVGELYALIAYVEVLFGELYCSGVPLSRLVDQKPEFGPQLTTTEMFERAVANFDLALANANENEEVLSLARVGRARALLNLGQYSDAAASVGGVPTSFRYEAAPDGVATTNGFFTLQRFRMLGVVDRKGENALAFVSASDPRVRLEPGQGSSGGNEWYDISMYASPVAPIELSSGIEARLIEAEAAFRANPEDVPGWLGILNELRSKHIDPLLPALDDPGSPKARVDLLFEERAFWTFATGRRLGDLRRLVRQYGRSVQDVFPVGMHNFHGTVPFGDAVNLTPPRRQFNHPDYIGCLSRDP